MRRYSLVFILFLLAAIGLMTAFLPWKPWIGRQLTASLEASGLQNVHLTVDDIDLHGIVLKDVSFGKDARLELQNITVGYSWLTLWQRRIGDIKLTGLTFHINQKDAHWTVDGIAQSAPISGTQTEILLPVTQAQLDPLPFDQIELTNSAIEITADSWRVSFPIDVMIRRSPAAMTASSPGGELHIGEKIIKTGSFDLTAKLSEADAEWQGDWHLNTIALSGVDPSFPVVQGVGGIGIEKDQIVVRGEFQSDGKDYRAVFDETYRLNQPDQSALILSHVSMPWNGGKVSIPKLAMPMVDKARVTALVSVDHVSIDAMAQQLSGKNIVATGTLSGRVPIILGPGNAIEFQQGTIAADLPGTLSMQPDLLPSDNEQLKLLRDVLHNFHFQQLSLSINGGEKTPLTAVLHLEGSSPEVYQGKAVKLNVNLGGDVLNLIRQNLMILTDPKTLIGQANHAHP